MFEKHLFAATLAIACLVGSFGLAECSKMCDRDWWKTATAADVQAELDAGAEVTARDQYG
jgi:hypothetical protein